MSDDHSVGVGKRFWKSNSIVFFIHSIWILNKNYEHRFKNDEKKIRILSQTTCHWRFGGNQTIFNLKNFKDFSALKNIWE